MNDNSVVSTADGSTLKLGLNPQSHIKLEKIFNHIISQVSIVDLW